MTENKIKPTMEQTIYCLKAESERYPEVCEECQLYGEVGCDHCYDDTNDTAIKFLKELEQYRAIGTVEDFKALKEAEEQKEDWIPCSEQKPPEYTQIYVTCHSLCDDRPDWVAETFYTDRWNIPIVDWGDAEVIAWMYVKDPKPYEEGEHD